LGTFGLVCLAVFVFSLPNRFEGTLRAYVGPGHALSTLATVALLPLLGGVVWLYGGLWRRRQQLLTQLHARPGRAGLLLFSAGLGVGLPLASSFSEFFWWWAIGAVLYGAAAITAAITVAVRAR